MYETNENKIEWKKIVKIGGMVLCIIVIILAIVAFVNSCNKKNNDVPKEVEPVTLKEQLDKVEKALLQYLDENSIPRELNGSKTVRVKMLKDKGLINELKDSQNVACDLDESFAEITRFEENYAVSISLSCGSNKENRLFYIGCFDRCDGRICKGESTETGGVCFEGSSDKKEDKDKEEDKKPSETKPTTNNKPASTSKPSNKPSTSKPSTTTPAPAPTPEPKVLYEYKKCYTKYSCDKGTLNADNKCVVETPKTLVGTFTTETVTSTKPNLEASNQFSYKYVYNGVKKGIYYYIKYSCNDLTYEFDLASKKCIKEGTSFVTHKAEESSYCDYTWSYTPVEGWTKTGRVK